MPMVPSPMTPTFMRVISRGGSARPRRPGRGECPAQRRMPGIRHNGQPRRGPCSGQLERGARRADHVVAPLHDLRRNMADAIHAAEQPLRRQEQIVREIVSLDAGEPQRRAVLREGADGLRAWQQACCTSPHTPTRRAPPADARKDPGRSGDADSRRGRRLALPPAGSRRRRVRVRENRGRPCRNQSTSAGRPRNTPRSTQPMTRSGYAWA